MEQRGWRRLQLSQELVEQIRRSGVTKGCLADESTGAKALFVEGSGVGSVVDCVLVCVM